MNQMHVHKYFHHVTRYIPKMLFRLPSEKIVLCTSRNNTGLIFKPKRMAVLCRMRYTFTGDGMLVLEVHSRQRYRRRSHENNDRGTIQTDGRNSCFADDITAITSLAGRQIGDKLRA